MIYTNKI